MSFVLLSVYLLSAHLFVLFSAVVFVVIVLLFD